MRNKIAIFLFCLALPALTPLSALALESSSDAPVVPGESWRKQAPALPPPAAFKMPAVTRFTLANGLQVELVEDHRVPFTTVGLGIKTGTVDDPKEERGLAALTAEMLSEGTTSKSSKQIAEAIDFIGGAFGAASGDDFTVVSASALSQYNTQLFDIFKEILLTPSFSEEELKLRKTNLIEEIKLKKSKPAVLAEEKFASVVFGSHPYSYVMPKPEMVEKVTRKELQNFYQIHYLPNESVLVVAGDFQNDKMKVLIENAFGSWKRGAMPAQEMSVVPKQTGRKIYLVDRPGSVQSTVKIGNIGIKRNDPDYYTMNVVNQVLGGAAISRLFNNIRENKGYTYGAYSESSAKRQLGSVSASAEVRTEVTAPAVQEFFYELDRIRNVKAGDKELEAAKNYLVGSFQLGLETQNGLVQRLLDVKLYDLPDNYLESYGQKIMVVTAEDVRRVARRCIDTDNLVITVVGDAAKIKGDLEYFAPVAVYDRSGAVVKAEQKGKNSGS